MRDLIPSRYPSNTLRGFLVRVATIAVAALIVLGAIDLIEYLQDTHTPHTFDQQHTGPAPQQNTP